MANSSSKKTLAPKTLEHEIQSLFIQYMALRGIGPLDFVHIPNRAYMGAKSSRTAAFSIAKHIGGLPDLTIYRRDKQGHIRALFIELKKEDGKPRPNQLIRAKRWPETKFCYSLDDAKAALDQFILECDK